MQASTIIYLGAPGLQAQILASYFSKLDVAFQSVCTESDLVALIDTVPSPIVVLAPNGSPAVVMQLVHELVTSSLRSLPHIFVLYEGTPFDSQLETVTVVSGSSKLTRLASDIRSLIRRNSGESVAA